ncbi:MAG: two-component system sensor histidine kinase NtrB [Planctomycetota bacterium]
MSSATKAFSILWKPAVLVFSHLVVGVVCPVEDVTDRERSEVALRECQQRFDAIAQVIPQAISYYSPQLEVLFGNRAYLESRDLEPADLPLPLERLMDESIRPSIEPHLVQALRGHSVRFMESIELADGRIHDLDRILLPDVGEDGTVHGFFSVCTDITDYRQAAQERLALETQVLQTHKLESLCLLSGKIAHEFNNRLGGILGHSDIARADMAEDPAKAVPSMERAIEIAREASDLCRQLYVYSGHGSGIKTIQCVNPLIQEMRRLLELTLPAKVRLRTILADDLGMVQIDAARLRRAIVNLVQNTAQSMGSNRGEILLQSNRVMLKDCALHESFLRAVAPETELVQIAVTDSGEGMDEETLAHVFEPFFSLRPGLRGLGLSGVLGIIHGHSGALGLDSEPGVGTTIRMWFAAEPTVVEASAGLGAEDMQHV